MRDAETFEEVGTPLVGHTAEVGLFDRAIYFFDDDHLVTLGQDATLRLWNLTTRRQIGDPLVSEGAAAFDAQPAANLVASATADHFLLWNYDTSQWFDIACQAAGRNLTVDEWAQFGPADEPYRATCPQWPAAEEL